MALREVKIGDRFEVGSQGILGAKRAKPGDVVRLDNIQLTLNGEPLEKPWLYVSNKDYHYVAVSSELIPLDSDVVVIQ